MAWPDEIHDPDTGQQWLRAATYTQEQAEAELGTEPVERVMIARDQVPDGWAHEFDEWYSENPLGTEPYWTAE